MADTDFDVIVIGAGPGGYVAAIRAAQLGLKTACVESRETLGGTCLNVGCIPSKALLHASELFEEAHHGTLAKWGVKTGKVELDLDAMHAGRKEAVKGLTGGIEFLFKKNKVDLAEGPRQVHRQGRDRRRRHRATRAKNFVIATGSSVTPLPGRRDRPGADRRFRPARSSWPRCRSHMVVIGGGVIGLELGSVWRRLGAKVTVVEFLDQILPGMDGEVRKEAQQDLQEAGLRDPHLDQGHQGRSARATASRSPSSRPRAARPRRSRPTSCWSRSAAAPTPTGSASTSAGLQLNKRGQIEVDHDFRTGVAGIYAIGDVTPGPMLAHKAEDEGIAVAEIIAGQIGIVNHEVIPSRRLHHARDRRRRPHRGGGARRRASRSRSASSR